LVGSKVKFDFVSPETDAPVTPVTLHNGVFVKRDDLFTIAGVRGGKVRTCYFLSRGAKGLVTAGSRSSPQINIVAHIAQHLGIPARCHAPEGELSPELVDAKSCGCEIIQHKAGYNSVIVARAHADAVARRWKEIPFGMECREAVRQTRGQVRNVDVGMNRIVMPVGSGMSLAGVLWGLYDLGVRVPVIGVVVGASPYMRLEKYAPDHWQRTVTLVESGSDYHAGAKESTFDGIPLDPFYEAKCIPYLRENDLFWIVGVRRTVMA
jgi:1-aminocyclopropane-1-carboxylate deaminase/D-cysteine desulfhydrase-like pyridoxal-dependent ACC family enzyme